MIAKQMNFLFCRYWCLINYMIVMGLWYLLGQRISMPEIRNHAWFLKNLPADLMDETTQFQELDQPMQSLETIMQIISEATILPAGLYNLDMMDDDDMDDLDSDPDLDIDSSGEVIYAMWLLLLFFSCKDSARIAEPVAAYGSSFAVMGRLEFQFTEWVKAMVCYCVDG